MPYNDQFPNEIDLGSSISEMGPSTAKDKEDKKSYPMLYISDVPELKDLPPEGYALIKFKRVGARLGEDDKLKSAELEVEKLCLPEEQPNMEDSNDEGQTLEEYFKKNMKDKADTSDE